MCVYTSDMHISKNINMLVFCFKCNFKYKFCMLYIHILLCRGIHLPMFTINTPFCTKIKWFMQPTNVNIQPVNGAL